MPNFGFIKCSRRERLKFFQSSLPYLHNNSLILTPTGKARKWHLEDPNHTNRGFLTFKNGHYGIYFTLFNHELRKNEPENPGYGSNKVIVIVRELPSLETLPEFSISKAKQDIQHDISWLKSVANEYLSTQSLLNPRSKSQQLHHRRGFHTAFQCKDKAPLDLGNFSKPDPLQDSLPEAVQEKAETALEDEPFEESFLTSQVSRIVEVFETHRTPADLDIVYPMYQALKRNDILLPSIIEYNIVLKSISARSLDSETTLSATETRLTCLLTVYQDILTACQAQPGCRPNRETYHIVLSTLFGSSRALLLLQDVAHIPAHVRHETEAKVLEFCQVGVDLLTSLPQEVKSGIQEVLPAVFYCLSRYPALLNKATAEFFKGLQSHQLGNPKFYTGLMSLTKALGSVLGLDKRASYDFVSGVFDTYKRTCQTEPHLAQAEYEVYSALIGSLVSSGNLPIATKFLDEVMQALSLKTAQDDVKPMSDLISTYLCALMDIGTPKTLDKAYDLVKKMREVSFLPDISCVAHNKLICEYIREYVRCEGIKTRLNADKISKTQASMYETIKQEYTYYAIRKDYRGLESTEMLLSLSLDLGDFSMVSRLLKEILLRDIAIGEWHILKKTCAFLCQQASEDNGHHEEVMWSIIEQQARYAYGKPLELNALLGELAPFILLNSEGAFQKVMNLDLVRLAFEKFDIQTSNMHGLMVAMSYMQHHVASGSVDENSMAKILTYQAHMINQFEDTENHYLDSSPQVRQFEQDIKAEFLQAAQGSNTLTWDSAVLDAAASLDLQLKNTASSPSPKLYLKNIIPYFNTSYSLGSARFIEHFKQGANFDEDTWKVVIDASFVDDVLVAGKVLPIRDFASRIVALGGTSLRSLLSRLISLHNDKVNIEVFKYLSSQNEATFLGSSEILRKFTTFAHQSQNQYFLTLFAKDFVRLARMNPDKVWMNRFLAKLNLAGRYEDVCGIIAQDFDLFNQGLDCAVKADERFLQVIFEAHIHAAKADDINELFKLHFAGDQQKKKLASSNALLACLLEYYTSIGSFDIVSSNFTKYASRSTDIKQSIQFSNFLMSISGSEVAKSCAHDANSSSFALALLNERDTLGMQRLLEKNKHLIADKEQFLNALVTDLTRAATLLDAKYAAKLSAKFEAVVKFCKLIHVHKICAKTLKNMVDFLAATNSRNLMNILFGKFLINNSLASSFNFYFLKVDLESEEEVRGLLNAFEEGFKKTGDLLNLRVIENFKSSGAHSIV